MNVLTRGQQLCAWNEVSSASRANRNRLLFRRLAGLLSRRMGASSTHLLGDGSQGETHDRRCTAAYRSKAPTQMNATLRQRLDRVDRAIHAECTTLHEQILKAACAAISDADVSLISEWLRRGAVECQPDVQVALTRYCAEADTAALRMTGRRFSKVGSRLHQRVPKRTFDRVS